jgi:hypothetical protein
MSVSDNSFAARLGGPLDDFIFVREPLNFTSGLHGVLLRKSELVDYR